MDRATVDPRALTLAARLLVGRTAEAAEWTNPETGTTCRLVADGAYVVLRLTHTRLTPVVAGQILPADAADILLDPESPTSRRAAAHAIVAVDRG